MVAPVPSTPGRITTVAAEYRDRLDAVETRAVVQMESSYRRIIDTLGNDLTQIEGMIRARQAQGLPTPVSWLHKQQRYSSLILQSRDAFDSYGATVKGILDPSQLQAIRLASKSAEALLEAALPNTQSILGSFNSLPQRSLEQLRGALQRGSPLDDLLNSFGSAAAADIDRALTTGLAKGLHPEQITKQVLASTDLTRTRAALITRTELYRSYREGNRSTYAANQPLVQGWVWHAHLGSRTCAACLAMHGTEHAVDEPMGSHPACRCTMLPKTQTWEELGFTGIPETRVTGGDVGDAEAWLKTQPTERQQAAFGNKKLWKGWHDGEYKLPDVVRRVDHPDWGTTRTIGGYDRARQNALLRHEAEEQARRAEEAAQKALRASQRVSGRSPWLEDVDAAKATGLQTEEDVRRLGQTVRLEAERRAQATGSKALAKERAKLEKALEKHRAELDAHMGKLYGDTPPTWEERQAIQKARQALYKKINDAEKKLREVTLKEADDFLPKDVLLDVLKDARPGYGQGAGDLLASRYNVSSKPMMSMLNKQRHAFPAEWWEDFQQREIITKKVARGYFSEKPTFGNDVKVMISSTGTTGEATAIHELTHFAEYMRPRIRQLEHEFYARRTAGESLEGMYGGTREVTRRDKFVHEYIGKDYGNTADAYHEVATMGVEGLMTPGARRWKMGDDLDYVDFILGLLAGV